MFRVTANFVLSGHVEAEVTPRVKIRVRVAIGTAEDGMQCSNNCWHMVGVGLLHSC